MAIIDISPPIHAGIGVWPGDVPFSLTKSMDIHAGAHMDLGSVTTTLHVGAHTDAHRHYDAEGADAADMPLEAYYGPCQVIDVDVPRGHRFGLEDLSEPPAAPRVLFRTRTFPDPDDWNDDFAAPTPELIESLAALGTVLVGFDTPSTDLIDSKELPSHHRLAQHGMVNLEGLVLDHVERGHYTLAAFPLRIRDADASPVRAVLITA